jgi:hypothetical protein
MKKILILGLLLVLSFSTVISAKSRHDFDRPGRHQGWEVREHPSTQKQLKAKEVLEETAEQLEQAQKAALHGHYRYGLGRAYTHQEQARDLYFDRQYERAQAHSLRAREIAVDIINANRQKRYERPASHVDGLDNQLSIKIIDDKVALRLHFTLD